MLRPISAARPRLGICIKNPLPRIVTTAKQNETVSISHILITLTRIIEERIAFLSSLIPGMSDFNTRLVLYIFL